MMVGFFLFVSEGLVSTWGANNFGQLGLGTNRGSKDTPEFINCLKGIPIAQIDVGGNHTIILSKSGAVYGWGRNRLVNSRI